jgi:predicted MFS family arabinose efflux permease
MVLPFLSLYLTQRLGFSTLEAGQLLSLFGFGSMIGSYVGGWLSDRLGSYRVLYLSFASSGFGFIVLGQLESFLPIAAAILTVSIVSDAFRPALLAAVAEVSSPEERPRAFALIRMAINLGMAVGPAAGGMLATHHYGWLFLADAVTCWLAGALLWGITHLDRSAQRSGELQTRTGSDTDISPWRDLPFLLFLVLIWILGIVFFQIFTTFPVYLRASYHLLETGIGSLLAVNGLLIVAVEMPLLHVLDSSKHLRFAAFGSLLVCLGLALLPLGSSYTLALLSMVVLTVGEMLCLPMANSFVASRAGSGATGRYMGAYTLAFSASFVVAPTLGTAVYDRFGGRFLWFGIGATGVFLWAGFTGLSRMTR